MTIRRYRTADNAQLVRLFQDTVHTVNAADYTPAQLDAWAPDDLDIDSWCEAFAKDYTLIAEMDSILVGFANLEDVGIFDRLYVHRDYQGMGIGKKLTEAIEAYARSRHMRTIQVDASITARPFFLKQGYHFVRENTVKRNGQVLRNDTMIKSL